MKYLDLSFEGRQLAERNRLDNGQLPHGGYRGSKKYPPCHLSYDKGREFQQKINQEVERILEEEDVLQHGPSPTWSILLHREPSYTDESPLITRNLLAASKFEQINGVTPYNRQSLLPNKCARPLKSNGITYYRPNRMHQYLSSTELKNTAQGEVNIKYGRPTRTTLLRARQRSNSAPNNSYEKRREYVHRMEDIKSASPVPSPTPEYLQLDKARDGESLHSYLTGARYNRNATSESASTTTKVPRVLSASLSEKGHQTDRSEATQRSYGFVTSFPLRRANSVNRGRFRRKSSASIASSSAGNSRRNSRDFTTSGGGKGRKLSDEDLKRLQVDSRRGSRDDRNGGFNPQSGDKGQRTAHCLDSKSVEHSGVYMPRNNPAMGSFFRGPKGQEYLQEFIESPRFDMPSPSTPTTPKSARRRPLTAPSLGTRAMSSRTQSARSAWTENQSQGQENSQPVVRSKYKHLKLNVIGNRLPIGLNKDTHLRLPSLQRPLSANRPKNAVEETYRFNQPPPTPNSIAQPKETQEDDVTPSATDIGETVEKEKEDTRGDDQQVNEGKEKEVREEVGEEKESNINPVPEVEVSVPLIVHEEQDERSEANADGDSKIEEKEEKHQAVEENPLDENATHEQYDGVVEETVGEGNEEQKGEEEKEEAETEAEDQIYIAEEVDDSTPEIYKAEDQTTAPIIEKVEAEVKENKEENNVSAEVADAEEAVEGDTEILTFDNVMGITNEVEEETPAQTEEAEEKEETKKEVRFFITEEGAGVKIDDGDESLNDKNEDDENKEGKNEENFEDGGTQQLAES